jgi:hypothetical protein
LQKDFVCGLPKKKKISKNKMNLQVLKENVIVVKALSFKREK